MRLDEILGAITVTHIINLLTIIRFIMYSSPRKFENGLVGVFRSESASVLIHRRAGREVRAGYIDFLLSLVFPSALNSTHITNTKEN